MYNVLFSKDFSFVNQVVADNDIHSIVMSYLLHNCFNETADSLASSTGVKQPAIDRDNMERRKRELYKSSFVLLLNECLCNYVIICFDWLFTYSEIIHFILERKALKAFELTEQLAQDLLEKNKDLQFDLLCLHFVELICAGNWWDFMIGLPLETLVLSVPVILKWFSACAAPKLSNLVRQDWLLLGRSKNM